MLGERGRAVKPIVLIIVIASLLLSSNTAAWSYDRYNVGGYWADKAGDKEKALELWKKAVELNEQQKDSGLPLNCDNVAGVLEELKRDAEAEPYRIKASQWWEKFGKLNAAAYSSHMAGVDQYNQKKYELAEASFRRSHQLYGQVKNATESQCNALHWVGLCQFARGQFSEALNSAKSFIELRRKNLKGKTQNMLAWDLEFQADTLNALQRYS